MSQTDLILEFIKHDPATARKILQSYLQTVGDNEQQDRVRLAIEFLCNPDFRKKLEDFSFTQTYRPAEQDKR